MPSILGGNRAACFRGTRRIPSRFDLSCHSLNADVLWSLTQPSLEQVASRTGSRLPPNATQFTDWLCLGYSVWVVEKSVRRIGKLESLSLFRDIGIHREPTLKQKLSDSSLDVEVWGLGI